MSDKKKKQPKVNPELEGFDVNINKFGEIKSTFDIDELNKFLDKNVEDKKLINRDDLDKTEDEEK